MNMNDPEEKLPPMPGSSKGIGITAEQKIMVDVQGQVFEMDPLDALAMANVILSTVEVYFRSK